jgi:hypothetical protein
MLLLLFNLSYTSIMDLDSHQLFSHIFSIIVNLTVHKLKKTLEKREKKHLFHFFFKENIFFIC